MSQKRRFEKALPLRRALDRVNSDTMTRSSLMMMSTTVVNSVIGYGFWILSARTFSASTVGAVGAMVSTATIASTLADLGLRTMLMQQLPIERGRAEWSRRVSSALVLALFSSTIIGVAAWALAPMLSHELRRFITPFAGLLTVLLTVALTVFTMLDGVSVAEHKASQIVIRNLISGLGKLLALGLLVLWGFRSPQLALAATVIGVATAALFGVGRQLHAARGDWRFTRRGSLTSLHDVRGKLAGHYILNLGGWLPAFVLPLEVVALESTRQNAYMTLTWMVGSIFFTVSPSVSSALFVQGRWAPDELKNSTRRAAKLIAALLIPFAIFVAIFGHLILGFFGKDYAHYGYPLLLVLLLSALPDAITNVRIGRLRAQGRLVTGARLNLGMAVIAIGLAWLLIPHLGIVGVGWAWLFAQSAGSLWGFVEDWLRPSRKLPADAGHAAEAAATSDDAPGTGDATPVAATPAGSHKP